MPDLFTPLDDNELDQLDNFLLERIDQEVLTIDMNEGIFDVSTLDGFFTAVISGPIMIPPSQWINAVWGDFEPEWQSDTAFEKYFSLLMRHMNSISEHLMEKSGDFEPLFMQRNIDNQEYIIVDEWCYGYMMGVELCQSMWDVNDVELQTLLLPIKIFGTEAGWEKLKTINEDETDNIRQAITPNVSLIHSYWLARREPPSTQAPIRRREDRIGRNDPCPCGSGKKYKKCCLH